MTSNSYLGLSLRAEVIAAEDRAARAYGSGPRAGRFISGTRGAPGAPGGGAAALPRPPARAYGSGPGAVRFISGTWAPHVALEERLAAFHGRPAGMLFSSAYAAVMGILPALITDRTAVISDELNHNCIINAIALGRPAEKHIYR